MVPGVVVPPPPAPAAGTTVVEPPMKVAVNTTDPATNPTTANIPCHRNGCPHSRTSSHNVNTTATTAAIRMTASTVFAAIARIADTSATTLTMVSTQWDLELEAVGWLTEHPPDLRRCP
ncbi:hypothetical protein Aglo01_54420 [Actinokineospora globicatena]|nr:hypothetical protein Aglo01_54420 [Actinokineospora globicatena]GLW88154.1 hypothetical protein Aglo02_57930 [Actinokineospora globicatena]